MSTDTQEATTQKAPKFQVTEAAARLRQGLNERLVDQCAKGQAPWQSPFDPAQGDRLPYDPFAKKDGPIEGLNTLVLASVAHERGYTDPRWITKNEMELRSWGPIKDQHPASVEYYANSYQRQLRDATGNPIFDQDGKAATETIKHEVPMFYAVPMYNLTQIQELRYAKEKIPKLEVTPRAPDQAGLTRLVAASGVEVKLDGGNHFSRTQDGKGQIHVPKEPGAAQNQALLRGVCEKAVLLVGPAGARRDDTQQARYIKQQLRVDLATRIMSDKLALPNDPRKMEAFKDKYTEILKNDPNQIRFAAQDAYRAVDRITQGNFTPSKEQKKPQEQQQAQQQEQQQAQQQEPQPEQQAGRQAPRQQQRSSKAHSKGRSRQAALER